MFSLATAHWCTAAIGRYLVVSANRCSQLNSKFSVTPGGKKFEKLVSQVLHATNFVKKNIFVLRLILNFFLQKRGYMFKKHIVAISLDKELRIYAKGKDV